MKKISSELIETVNNFYNKYKNLDEKLCSKNPAEDKWSLKEIIGHLIDSASNNHQRIVRLQLSEMLDFPSYHYSWIETEKFNLMNFNDILSLWKYYNILLGHLIKNVKEEVLKNYWNKEDKKLTLEFIINDYLRHLKDHIKHFEERLKEIK